jgi:cytochrome c553
MNDQRKIMAAALAFLMLSACSNSTDSSALSTDGSKIENPFRGVMQDRTAKSPDEALFVAKCSMCHRQMGMGTVILARRMKPATAMLEKRSDLKVDYIKTAVRQGIGNMPRIGRGEVSDAQLQQISNFLTKGAADVSQK